MNSGHKTVYNAEVVVNNLGERSQAVCCTGSIGNDIHIAGVFVIVNAHDKHRSVFGRSGDNNFFRTAFKVGSRFIHRGEYAGGLYNILGAAVFPRNFFRIHTRVNFNGLAVNGKFTVFHFNRTFKFTVHGVILGHINHVIHINERIVDSNNLVNINTIFNSHF